MRTKQRQRDEARAPNGLGEELRRVWLAAYAATAASTNVTQTSVCKNWADSAVKDYLETFYGK